MVDEQAHKIARAMSGGLDRDQRVLLAQALTDMAALLLEPEKFDRAQRVRLAQERAALAAALLEGLDAEV